MLGEPAAVLTAEMPTSPAALLALASDPNMTVRARATAELRTWGDDPTVVADVPLPADRLAVLAGHTLAWVRAGVADNPSTDEDTLARLATDTDQMVRLAVAARLDLPAAVSTHLTTDTARWSALNWAATPPPRS